MPSEESVYPQESTKNPRRICEESAKNNAIKKNLDTAWLLENLDTAQHHTNTLETAWRHKEESGYRITSPIWILHGTTMKNLDTASRSGYCMLLGNLDTAASQRESGNCMASQQDSVYRMASQQDSVYCMASQKRIWILKGYAAKATKERKENGYGLQSQRRMTARDHGLPSWYAAAIFKPWAVNCAARLHLQSTIFSFVFCRLWFGSLGRLQTFCA